MPRLIHRPPKYRLHKGSGQAIVSVNGKRMYLGVYGSPKSHELYEKAISEWRRSLPSKPQAKRAAKKIELVETTPLVTAKGLRKNREEGREATIDELICVYRKHTHEYYRKNGKVTREAEIIDEVLRFLSEHHGDDRVDKFGPVKLDELRDQMIDDLDWSRKHINKQVSRIVRMFRWAVEKELAPPESHSALAKLMGLKKGRSRARETSGVSCVDDTTVQQTIALLSPIIADMVRLQRLTGARPGEVCTLRPGDIDRSAKIWIYKPQKHKTEHHDHHRVVMIGPQAQAILRPYLLRAEDAYCFTPEESERMRFAKLASERKTPQRKRDRDRQKLRSLRIYAPCYDTSSYRHAVQRVCARAGLTKWSPNQLRHNAATEIRKKYGLEAAQVVCGHQSADITQVYAERDMELARRVAHEMG